MVDYSRETRAIYHDQHRRVLADERAMQRFVGMFDQSYFGVSDKFFQDKRCLDAGCGNTAKLLIALYRMGARDLHAFDLGDEWIPDATASLEAHGVPAEAFELSPGSVLDIPQVSESFDFVSCHGVLLHLNTKEEAERGFQELARTTRPAGHLYTVWGLVGGVWEDAIIPAARDYYAANSAFRQFIDNIAPDDLHYFVDTAVQGLREHEGVEIDAGWLKDLLDVDLCVTVQNAIQAPVRLAITEHEIRRMYDEAGFEAPRRLRRYVKRRNLRRFFAPLHYATPEDPKLQLLYGSGNQEFVAVKKR